MYKRIYGFHTDVVYSRERAQKNKSTKNKQTTKKQKNKTKKHMSCICADKGDTNYIVFKE
jgi:hypothetical protein